MPVFRSRTRDGAEYNTTEARCGRVGGEEGGGRDEGGVMVRFERSPDDATRSSKRQVLPPFGSRLRQEHTFSLDFQGVVSASWMQF